MVCKQILLILEAFDDIFHFSSVTLQHVTAGFELSTEFLNFCYYMRMLTFMGCFSLKPQSLRFSEILIKIMDELQPLFKHSCPTLCYMGWSEKMLHQDFSVSSPAWAGGGAFSWAAYTWGWCRNGWEERTLSWCILPLLSLFPETWSWDWGVSLCNGEESLPAFLLSALLLQLI